MTLKLDTLNDY